jgi:hypothetical protein
MQDSISLPLETIKALNKAANILEDLSNGRYEIVLVRGHIKWNIWRKMKGIVAKIFFCALYWSDRIAINLLFNSNGHDDGLSVDILPYDTYLKTNIKFLSWKNIMIDRNTAEYLLKINSHLISMIDRAMNDAGFIGHPDPREKLQMHYRYNHLTELP